MKMYALVLNTNDWFWWNDIVVVSRKIEKLKSHYETLNNQDRYVLVDRTTPEGLEVYNKAIKDKLNFYSIDELKVI